MSAEAVAQLVRNLDVAADPRLLSDPRDFGDAGIVRLDDHRCLVQSVDFFAPLVDDPEAYGRIAAANSLSDLYACGATPLTAMNIVAFPDDQLDLDILSAIMRGAADAVAEAEALLIGGHSIRDREIKFGLAVTGIAETDSLMSNSNARPGDVLVLTKPLGTGVLATAMKSGFCAADVAKHAIESMSRLNRVAAEVARKYGTRAATDITGFGLAGHAVELAESSGVTLRIETERLNVLPGVDESLVSRVVTRGQRSNQRFYEDKIRFFNAVEEWREAIIFDPQTSGGLLLAVAPDVAGDLIEELQSRGEAVAKIGQVIERAESSVVFV